MLSKHTTKNLVLILLVGFSLPPEAANLAADESVSIFSNWNLYPTTGDCEGHTLTLVRDKESRFVRGYLQTYEGNCEDMKVPITNVQLNREKGKLSFSAASYVQDGKGGLEVFAEWRFVGVIAKKKRDRNNAVLPA